MYPIADDFERKVTLVLVRALGILAATVLLFLTADIVLVLFAGLLLGVFLVSLAEPISQHLKFSYRASLAAVILTLLMIATGILVAAAPAISQQVDRLAYMVPAAYDVLLQELQKYEWGNVLLRETQKRGWAGTGAIFSRATGVLSGTAGRVVSSVIFLFIGFYAAVNPQTYTRGFVRLFMPAQRSKVSEILASMGHALRWWLLGRLAGMVVVGVVTSIALRVMDIPLAGLLGLISGLLTFIPNLGPLISAIPVVLIALMESPSKALFVAGFYTVLQTAEGYVLTPLILQRTVSLPPALLLSTQALLGSLLGLSGVAMAAPLTVIGMVVVNMVWLERIEKLDPVPYV